jgi:hypothetical protein
MSDLITLSAARTLSIARTALLAVLLTGCSKPPPLEPVTNGGSAASASGVAVAGASGYGSGSFYPLAIGNTWAYEGWASVCLVREGVDISECLGYRFTETRRLIGTTHHEGTAYVVEEQVHHSVPEDYQGPITWWSRLRQDRFGLFSLDTLLQHPPVIDGAQVAKATGYRTGNPYRIDTAVWQRNGLNDALLERFSDRIAIMREAVRGIVRRGAGPAAPTGVELRFLVYPLRHGTSWSIRPDFPWPAWVDGVEVLDTPAGKFVAHRIGVNPFGTAPQDGEWIYLWYSRQGFLGYSLHASTPRTGPDGEPTGDVYVFEESMRVTSVHVAR